MSASSYTRGGTLYNSLEAKYGTAKAEQAWRDAIAAEQSGTNVDGIWRANEDAMIAGKSTQQLDGSFWSNLGGQLYNDPLAAPLEQAGNITKGAIKAAAGNWGVWIIVAVVAVVAFIYFGGSGFIRNRVKNLK